MNTLIYVVCGVGLSLFVALIASIVWLSKARKGQVEAAAATETLTAGKALTHEANKIMAEPVADESQWVIAARERVRKAADRES